MTLHQDLLACFLKFLRDHDKSETKGWPGHEKSGLKSGFEAKTSLSSTIRLCVGHSLLSNYFFKVSQNIVFLSNPKQNGAVDVASSRLHTICLLLSSPVVLLKEIQYEEANSGL